MKIGESMKKSATLLMVITGTFLVSCTNQFQSRLQESISINESVKDHMTWEGSSQNPEFIFQDFNKEFSEKGEEVQNQICEALMKLNSEDLSVFENEIKKSENSALLSSCRGQLISKLEDYWRTEKIKLKTAFETVSGSIAAFENFKFQTQIVKRDFSKGYYVVTGDINPKELILSFDDGPHASNTPMILEALKNVDAKATFFPLGQNVKRYPNLIKQEAADEHAIGSHTMHHYCLDGSLTCTRNNRKRLSSQDALNEIRGGHQAVYDVLGWVDPMFRFPYGAANRQLENFLAQNSVAEFFWAVDSLDWKKQSNTQLLNNILRMIDSKKRGVVLMHDIQRRTAEILPTLLKQIYFRGYTLVVLQDMDANSRYNSKLVIPHPTHL